MSDTTNLFVKDPSYYTRNINPIGQYIKQGAFYLAKMTGQPLEACEAFVRQGFKERRFPNLRDPVVKYYERQDNGDRRVETCRLSRYIQTTLTQGDILAPSGTTYLHPTVKQSLIVEFIDDGVKERSKAKKAAFVAKAEKNIPLYIFMNNRQNVLKIANNSFSGLFGATGSVFHNPTAHSTLTSTTRSVSSFANASNERIIGGNRHYHSPYIAINNIITIVSHTDYALLDRVIAKYGLVYPTVDQALDCVRYSAKHYWGGDHWLQEIRELLSRLSPLERAAFVYTGDLFHLRKLNDQAIRQFLEQLTRKVTTVTEDPLKETRRVPESILNLAHQICSTEVRGKGKNYEKMQQEGVLDTLVGTALNVQSTLSQYQDFIEAFFLSDNVPVSIAYLPHMIRQGVVLSDTDSTCVSKDEWVKWYRGEIIFDELSYALAGGVMFIATEALAHTLALFSANINVAPDKLDKLAMKSEFFWPVMIPTNVAKHYYAWTMIKEGNVYEELEPEIKGVHLKNSNTPGRIRGHADQLMRKIMGDITNNQKLSLRWFLGEVIQMEQFIETSLLNGEIEFLRKITIKDAEAYSEEADRSMYRHHLFWHEVFEPKYGRIEKPPYVTAKIPTVLETPTAMRQWVESLEDLAFKQRLVRWLTQNNKAVLPTIYLPTSYLLSSGMIPEIKPIIDTRRTVLDLCKVYELIMESLGVFKKPNLLYSDYYGFGKNPKPI
jgi:hypothetical protein